MVSLPGTSFVSLTLAEIRYAKCNNTTKISISLIATKGNNSPPKPYTKIFLVSMASDVVCLYATPFNESGIRQGIIIALNIIADNIAL